MRKAGLLSDPPLIPPPHTQPEEGRVTRSQRTRGTLTTTKLEEACLLLWHLDQSCADLLPLARFLLGRHLPLDWRLETRLPEGTLPPLALAVDDIILAAKEEREIPVLVKPMVSSNSGAALMAMTPPITAAAVMPA